MDRTIIPVEERKPRRKHRPKAKPPTLRESDDAFRARLMSAVEAGHERVPSPPTAPDDRVIPHRFAATHVLTASSSEF